MSMPDYNFRPATWDDFQTAFEILREQNWRDYDVYSKEDTFRAGWQTRTLSDSTWLMFNSQNICVAYADIETNASELYFIELYLHSDYQQSSIASSLLAHIETELSGSKTLTIKTRVSSKNDILMQLFQTARYEIYLSFLTMAIHLEELPEIPELPAEFILRPFIAEQDTQAVYQVDESASLDKGYSKPMNFEQWSKRVNLNGETFNPAFWHLACYKDEIVGVAINAYNPETDTAWIDHLSVLRHWRKRGLGRALLLKSFATFYQHKITHIKLNVDSQSLTNAPKLYENVGMKTVQQYHFFQKTIEPISPRTPRL